MNCARERATRSPFLFPPAGVSRDAGEKRKTAEDVTPASVDPVSPGDAASVLPTPEDGAPGAACSTPPEPVAAVTYRTPAVTVAVDEERTPVDAGLASEDFLDFIKRMSLDGTLPTHDAPEDEEAGAGAASADEERPPGWHRHTDEEGVRVRSPTTRML